MTDESGYASRVPRGDRGRSHRRWLMLALLLQPWPGREQEAEAAFRAAMADDHLDTRTRAASELGFMLAVLERDLEGARDCRAGATEGFRAVFVERYRAWNLEAGEDEPRRFAGAIAGLFLRPRSRRLFQRLQAARYRPSASGAA